MTFLGQIIVIIGLSGLLWFGVPTIVAASSILATKSTGEPVPPERMTALREGLYRLSGSIVVIAAGATILYLS